MCDFDGTFGHELLDGLDSLVQKSLLRQRADSDGEPRFWMLETIREFGLELLESAGELEAGCERHAAWTAGEAERLDAESRTGNHPAFLARVDDEYPNVREAIAFARKAHDGELLLRLATALWGFWSSRVYGAEGRRALEEALELSGRRPARTLLGLYTLRMLSGSSGNAREAAKEALEACEELGDDYSLAQAWNLVGRVEGTLMGSLATAEDAWRQALSFARRGNYRAALAETISWLMVSAVFGPLPVEEGIARSREFVALEGEDPTIRATCSVERAVLEAMRGDIETARELLAEGRRTIEEAGLTLWDALNAQETYLVEQLAGTPGAAAETLRQSYETLEEGGERAYRSTIAGFLAHALVRRGQGRGGGALQPRERAGRLPRRRASHRWSGGQRARRSWRGGASSSPPRRWRARRCGSASRATCSEPAPTRSATWPRCSRWAAAARMHWPRSDDGSELYERKGNVTALARARQRGDSQHGSLG